MSFASVIKRLLPESVIQFIRKVKNQSNKEYQLYHIVSPALTDALCIDVGASYYPHGKWRLFLESAHTQWVAVEPNENNIGYIKDWEWKAKVKAITTGLSKEGGRQTLYVTHVDSGSSLLEPVISASMKHRIKKAGLEYFYPVRTTEINTITLADVINAEAGNWPVFVKLDTQGTELSILQGAQHAFDEKRMVGIELESTLLAQPVMKDSAKFWEACQFLEQMGFELLEIEPIRAQSNIKSQPNNGICYLNECNAIFALRRDIAQVLPTGYRVALFAFYLANKLYEEALAMLDDDAEIKDYFASKAIDVSGLSQLIFELA